MLCITYINLIHLFPQPFCSKVKKNQMKSLTTHCNHLHYNREEIKLDAGVKRNRNKDVVK